MKKRWFLLVVSSLWIIACSGVSHKPVVTPEADTDAPVQTSSNEEASPTSTARFGSLEAIKAHSLSTRAAFIQSSTPRRVQEMYNCSSLEGALILEGVKTLHVDDATAITEYRGRCVFLDDLEELSPEVAKALAGWSHGHELFFGGLKHLDKETAAAIAAWKGESKYINLSLDGLETLDAEVARALASWRGDSLNLGGLKKIDVSFAEAFVEWNNGTSIGLGGIESLDAETARVIASWDREMFFSDFNDLKQLGAETAEEISTWRRIPEGWSGLTSLDVMTAKKIASWEVFSLRLNGLVTADTEVIQALASGSFVELFLDGLQSLDEKGAEALASCCRRLLSLGVYKASMKKPQRLF